MKAECIYTRLWVRQDRHSNNATTRPVLQSSTSTSNQLGIPTTKKNNPDSSRARSSRLSAKDDAKLIFGTIFSLRNTVRKLGGPDDSFISYRTGQYKLHYYETPTNVKFIILTDIGTLNMRNVLHQIYVNLYVEYGKFVMERSAVLMSIQDSSKLILAVIKNPLSPIEHKGGEGVANELFELALDQFVKGLL